MTGPHHDAELDALTARYEAIFAPADPKVSARVADLPTNAELLAVAAATERAGHTPGTPEGDGFAAVAYKYRALLVTPEGAEAEAVVQQAQEASR